MSYIMFLILVSYILSIILILKNGILNISNIFSSADGENRFFDIITIVFFPLIVLEYYTEKKYMFYDNIESKTVKQIRLQKVLSVCMILLYPFHYLRKLNKNEEI